MFYAVVCCFIQNSALNLPAKILASQFLKYTFDNKSLLMLRPYLTIIIIILFT